MHGAVGPLAKPERKARRAWSLSGPGSGVEVVACSEILFPKPRSGRGNRISLQGVTVEIIVSDADGFDRYAGSADLAVVLFTRAEIEAAAVGSAVERLMLFSDVEENVRKYEGRVALMFEGYDSDTRSLVEIPECVAFFRAVDREWSYWLHFLVARPDALNLAFLLLADVRPLSLNSDRRTFAVNDPDQLTNLFALLFNSMNTLHTNYGVPDLANRRRTEIVLRSLLQARG
jgi:hypothetical protein